MEDVQEEKGEKEVNTKFTEWSTVILEECKLAVKNDSGNRDNLHYVPELLEHLLPMCVKLPLWTGIMVPIFGYGTRVGSSSSVESYFKELKINFMGNNDSLRVDNFLMQHIKINDGSLNIAAATSTFQEDPREGREAENRAVMVENDNIPTENQAPNPTVNITVCIACSMGNPPEGAHQCFICQKPVHALDGCSLPIGEEGYRQKRQCMSCSTGKNPYRNTYN